MKRLLGFLGVLAVVTALVGCAHPITLTPDATRLTPGGDSKVDRKVGLVVSDDMRKRQVTSPGGGGDKVSYLPYRDLEAGLYAVLQGSFSDVTLLPSAGDPKARAAGLNYVVMPTIVTTSFSPSLLTWPPTVFTVELTCSIRDLDDKPVSEVHVQGEGRAEFEEFKNNPSLSAQRASEDALRKLQAALRATATRLP